jgi:hypothetical protein
MDQASVGADLSRMNTLLRSLPLLFAFTACTTTAEDPAGDVDTADDGVVDGKADGVARPAGVYSRTEATDGQLMELMLLPDHTFLRFEASGDWRERGTYTFTKSTTSTRRYIRFLDEDGDLIDRYTYTINGSVVRLSHDGGAVYPMFSTATGAAAWTEAVKTDWFDEAFQDWGAEAFPRTGVHRGDLPASAQAVFDQVAASMGPNEYPSIYRFDLHGARGYEMDGGSPRVRLFDAAGHQVASGDGDSMFDFAWR